MTEVGSPLITERPQVGPGICGQPRYHYTVEQYLSFERGVPSKHEYFNGDIYAFIGANEATA